MRAENAKFIYIFINLLLFIDAYAVNKSRRVLAIFSFLAFHNFPAKA